MSNEHSLNDLLPLLKLNEYISFDFETTGLNPEKDRITEISACKFVNGEFSKEFTSLINPEIPIPKNITALTGITNQMVKDAPLISDILPDLLDFIDNTPLVGQNVDFDYQFLINNIAAADLILPDIILYDTLSFARSFIYFHNSFSLGSLCDFYDIKIENGDYSEKSLQSYPDRMRKDFGKNHDRFYNIKEAVERLTDNDLDSIAEKVLAIPHDQRTLTSVFKAAVFKKPTLIIDVLKVFAGV